MKSRTKIFWLMTRNSALWLGQYLLIGVAILLSVGFIALLSSLESHHP
ncbi:MAG TPA: hypothetical protein VIM56_06245 [Rhizomicrobium sp.]